MSSFDARNVTQGGQVFKYMIAMFIQIMNVVSYWSLILAILVSTAYLAIVTKWEQAKHGAMFLYVKHIAVKLPNFNQDIMHKLYEFDWTDKQGVVHHLSYTYEKLLNDKYFQMVGRALQLDLFWSLGVFIAVFFGVMMIAFGYLGRKGKAQRKNDIVGGRYLAKSVAEVNRLLKSRNELSPFKIGDLHIVLNSEVQNIAVHGTLGTGKSTTFNDFLTMGRKFNQRAIIYDKGCTFITMFYREGKDIILNPMDARCPNWDLWEECQDKIDLENFAIPLLPETKGGDPFWVLSARNLFVSTAEAMRKDEERSIRKLLNILLNIPLSELREYVKEQDAASLVEGSIEKTAITIRAVLGAYARALRVCQGLDEKEGEKFSLSRWVRSDNDAWIFLSSDGRVHETVKPLITAWLNVAMQNVLALTPDPLYKRRIWTIIDELNSLHKLPMLLEYMSEARKFGGVTMLGLQSFAQIEENYGEKAARAIWDLVNTVAYFRAPSGAVSEWVQNELGEIQHLKFKDQYSYGADSIRDGVNFTKEDTRENIVSYSNIQTLNDLECYVSLRGNVPIVKVKLERKSYPLIAEGKFERDMSSVFNPEQDKLIEQATLMGRSDEVAERLVKSYGKPNKAVVSNQNAETEENTENQASGSENTSLEASAEKELNLIQEQLNEEKEDGNDQLQEQKEFDQYNELTNNTLKHKTTTTQQDKNMEIEF